ncbi:TIGR03086 family metal-binding protein [Cryptosporangium aurantiacum]|uniref:TIGR03086 family protein n=1 Tax=Cryptosporangium aurantiacum TaxID=134849 RepID=A0A1M7RL34_9ACTN|nr:TIGR03086 family metal-binding protein [Cryptosporangium aurantiacum]SHN46872.1 TIGR03086 family protein [Cryptosporangium aurantiacum]
MSSTTEWVTLEQAHQALRSVAAQLGDADWARHTPCEHWNVAQVLRHAAGDQRGYAAAITGSGGPTEDPFAPSENAPESAQGYLESALSVTTAAFATVAPATPEVPCPLPIGPLSAEQVVDAAALDAAVHAWDIAVAIGVPSPLSDELAEQLTPIAETIAGPLRAFAFGPAQDSESGDGAAARLLRFLGRTPDWKP